MFNSLLLLTAVLLSIPLLVVGSECLIALLAKRSTPNDEALASGISYKILIPAHNEAAIISNTLGKLIPALPDANPQHVVLIADNCTDDTAKIAKTFNINVLERNDSNKRGKGFALDFGIQQLSKNPPDVLVILDADCETSKSSLIALINTVIHHNKPAQMTYLMQPVQNASLKQKIAGFAWLLKNKIRLIGMNALQFPVVLTGTGMAFPWQVFDKISVGNGNIVEDMQLGIDCANNGFAPVFCENALVISDFPEQSSAELSQRTRWEHGHLQTILQQVPGLLQQAWRQKNIGLLALALDIGVPPLSFQILLTLCGLLALAAYALMTGYTLALTILTLSFLYFTAMLALIWRKFGQPYLTAAELAGIPQYVASKLSIYFAFITKRQKDWIRTERDS